jgi:hypothetical protein
MRQFTQRRLRETAPAPVRLSIQTMLDALTITIAHWAGSHYHEGKRRARPTADRPRINA